MLNNKVPQKDKLKIIFAENNIEKFEEKDICDLKQFFVSVIKIGLNNKDISEQYFNNITT